jgi:hypothetical protein
MALLKSGGGAGAKDGLRSSSSASIQAALAVLLIAALFVSGKPLAAQSSPTEYEVKAAFLLNFARFVEWPPEVFPASGEPLTVCILGQDPFGPAIDTMLQGQTAAGRALVARRITGMPPAGTCHVVYFGRSVSRVGQILRNLEPGVLTVGETDNFLEEGGMIHFVPVGQRIRFDMNARNAAAAGLRISSQLLRVARSVR